MTKINNKTAYPLDVTISDNDFVIGSDADNIGKITKNYAVGDLRRFINAGLSPDTGGTLRISDITYNGLLTSPADVANALDPAYEVLQYHVVLLSVNGNKYLLKLQDRFIGVDQTAVLDSDFILFAGFESLGDGTDVLKGYNTTTGKQEFYSVKSTGNTISIVSDNIVIDPKEGTNLGEGQPIYKGLNTSTKLHEFYTIKSNTLNIELNDSEVFIDTPETASIPALYVNDLYVPTEEEFLAGNTKGEGTLAKPFTNTVTAYVAGVPTITANTAIQNALDAYVGSGTRLAPERSGEQIIVQDNNGFYTFSGDFGYSNINIKLETTIVSTITGYVLDADNVLHFNNVDSATIELASNGILQIQGLGFNNSGSDVATSNLVNTKTITLIGEGRVECLSNTNPLTRYITNSDITETGNNNDGSLTFDIRCFISATYQGVYNVKGKSRIDVRSRLQSGDLGNAVNTSLKAFNQEGGTVRLYNTSVISLGGGTRTDGITFTPNASYDTTYSNNGGIYEGACVNLFNKLNTEDVTFTVVSTENGTNITTTNIFESPNLWEMSFRNNIFATGSADFTKVDFTQGNNVSSVNIIGNNIIESLRTYASKAAAATAGLPLNSVFLISKTVTAGSFIIGKEYKIVSVGTTDFTLIGASANTVGLWFVATGVGTGTGTAKYDERTILT